MLYYIAETIGRERSAFEYSGLYDLLTVQMMCSVLILTDVYLLPVERGIVMPLWKDDAYIQEYLTV